MQASPAIRSLFGPAGLAHAMPLAVIAWDVETRITGWNPAAEQLFGWPEEEAMGRSIFELLVPPSAHDHVHEVVRSVLAGQREVRSVNENVTRDGRALLCEWTNTRLIDADGGPVNVVSIGRDVTRERQVERERERLHAIATTANRSQDLDEILLLIRNAAVEVGGFDRAGIWLVRDGTAYGAWGTDAQGNLRDERGMKEPAPIWNAAFRALLSGERPTAIDQWLVTEGPPSLRGQQIPRGFISLRTAGELVAFISVDNLLTRRPVTEESLLPLARFAEQAAVAVRNARLFRELSEAQDALVRSEKMRALGALARSVGHDVNNYLTVVLAYAEDIQEAEDSSAHVRSLARTIERAARDGARIVHRLQQSAGQGQRDEPELLDLTELAQHSIELSRPFWLNQPKAHGVEVRITEDLDGPVPVLASAAEIREVAINIIKNAAEAMPEGGTLAIRCYKAKTDAVLEFTDTGTGMDEETRRRVFEQYFTTKPPGLGTGLGLSVAWGIIQQHGGRLEVESSRGKGSTFRIRLPLAARPSTQEEAGEEEATGIQGLHVLLVENEEMVAEGLARILVRRGADLEMASSGAEAMEWLEGHAESCDVVLADLVMAEMNGAELLKEIQIRYPNLRRVLLSGLGPNPPGDVSAAEIILAKPIPQSELIHALASLRTPIKTSP